MNDTHTEHKASEWRVRVDRPWVVVTPPAPAPEFVMNIEEARTLAVMMNDGARQLIAIYERARAL